MNDRKCQAGFTLIESLISVVIFCVLSGMIFLVLTISSESMHANEARLVTQQNMRMAIGKMIREIGESNEFRISIPAKNQIVFQIPIRDTSGGTYDGKMLDNKNSIIFGARPEPSTDPDGVIDYAIQYLLVSNNDISGSSRLVRRVFDGFPSGIQVGNDIVIANFIEEIEFRHSSSAIDYYTDTSSGKVAMCDLSGGTPQDVDVDEADVQTRLENGDTLGPCDEGGANEQFSSDAKTIIIEVTAIKMSKRGRLIRFNDVMGITLRN